MKLTAFYLRPFILTGINRIPVHFVFQYGKKLSCIIIIERSGYH